MAKILTLDEMLQVLINMGDPSAQAFKESLEATGTLMAQVIGERAGVAWRPAAFESVDLAGTCSCFGPAMADEPVPAALEPFDRGGDWEVMTREGVDRRPAATYAQA